MMSTKRSECCAICSRCSTETNSFRYLETRALCLCTVHREGLRFELRTIVAQPADVVNRNASLS